MWTQRIFKTRQTCSNASFISHVSDVSREALTTAASAVSEDEGTMGDDVWNPAEAGDRHRTNHDALPLCKPVLPNGAAVSLPHDNVTTVPKPVSPSPVSTSQPPEDAAVVSNPVSPDNAPGSPAPDVLATVRESASPPAACTSLQLENVPGVYRPVSALPARSLHQLDDVIPVAQRTMGEQPDSQPMPEPTGSYECPPKPRLQRFSRASVSSAGRRFSLFTDMTDLRSGVTSAFAQSTFMDVTAKTSRFAQTINLLEAKTTPIICGLLLIVLCLFVLVLFQSTHGRGEGGMLCASQDCKAHRSLFNSVLDRSVDPCQDFDAFVCPYRKSRRNNASLLNGATSTLSFMQMRWLDGLRGLLENGERILVAGRKPAIMYNHCLTQNRPSRDAVTQFMETLGLRWLQPREPQANAFGLLLHVAYNWQAQLWFRVAVLPKDTYHPVLRVLISRNPQMAEWQAELEGINGAEKYRRRWSETESVPADDRLISRHLETTMNIFRLFLNGNASVSESPRKFSLGDASNHASFASDLTLMLNQHIKPNSNFSRKDMMIFEEARLLEATNAAFARYENGELLQHLCWLFRDVYGPIADPSRLVSNNLGPDANKTRLRYCSFAVESSYKLLVNSLFAVTRLTPEERLSIDGLLSAVQREAVQLVRDADWLEWRSQSIAIAKLEGIQTVLWPRGELLTNDGLFRIYRFFPDRATSFTGYWVKAREAIRKYHASDPQGWTKLFGNLGAYVQPLVSYSHVLNTVFVSMAALARPLFYGHGTQAMLYGGLGYQYARQVVRAVDNTGVHIDSYGSVTHRWLSRASAAEYYKRVTCFGAVNLFPEAAAVELAYRAYRRAVEKLAEEPKLFTKMSEAQVFFVTLCLGMCHQQRGQSARACNNAVMAFRPFADAFRCAPGSNVSARQKCEFFR